MNNKKVLSKAVSELNKAKAPAKPKDIITDPMGQWKYPGQNTRIPGGNVTMQGVDYPVWAQPSVGPGVMMQPGENYNFPGAEYVDEYPQMKKGGPIKLPKVSKKGKLGKGYSRSLEATNRLFTENILFSKPKSRKNKVYDPNASFYQEGGSMSFDYDNTFSTDEGLEMAKDKAGSDMYIISARPEVTQEMIDRAEEAGIPQNRIFATGSDKAKIAKIKELGVGTHLDDKQSVVNKLGSKGSLFQDGGYIDAELTEEEIQAYRDGGYVVEETFDYKKGGALLTKKVTCKKCGWKWDAADGGDDITTCHKCGGQGLVHAEKGGVKDLDPATMAKYLVELKQQENNSKKGYRNGKWYPHSSAEGGADTIAYGHKLTPADNKYYQGITTQQAEALQQSDVLNKQAQAKKQVDTKYGAGTFDRLPQDAQMLLVDYQYNVGLKKFPSFVDATVRGDKAKMLKEYERGSSAGKLTKRNNWTKSIIENLDYTAEAEPMVPVVPLANVADATVVVPQVQPIPPVTINPLTGLQYQEGGDVISANGWDYQKDGNQYLTRKTGSEQWIPAQGTALTAIKQQVYNEPVEETAQPPVQPPAPINVTTDPIPVNSEVIELQKKLKAAGYNLGNYGPNKDGIDGQMGNRTKLAQDAFNAGIPPSKVKTPDPTKKVTGQVKNYTVNTNLRDGYLPYLNTGEEVCEKGKGCSANVSIKMGNLLGNITDQPLWANDAWFNKSDVLNKGGDLVYENQEKDFAKMQKVPKDVWSKLQVGDYVQLNRADTGSSARFAEQSKPGLENEGIEHLGFIVGKDKDGTPLIWHGSTTGKAYVQRIDRPISLPDENKLSNSNTFTYQVSSIVRSPSLKDKDFSGLQETGYYSPLDSKKKLVPKKGATELQSEAAKTLNSSVGQFKNAGYTQDDVNYIGQILIGGIMSNETQGGESIKRVPKEIAATIWKNYLGQGNFEGDEASIGYYQMKPNLNFTNKDGSLNPLGKKLEKLGMSVDDIASNDVNSQTKAGTLILLDAYSELKKDKDFNPKTGLYKNKIPASYIIAKSWQAGTGWYKREKYQKYLDNFDIDYSNNALKQAVNTLDYAGSNNQLQKDYYKVNQGITAREKAMLDAQKAKSLKELAAKNKMLAEYEKQNPNLSYSRNVPTESTAVYNPYKDSNKVVPFNVNDYTKKPKMQSTVYKYPGRPGVTYKKDSNGKWYVNSGKATGNKYIAVKDPSGSRTKALVKGAVKAKEGGIVTNLTQAEIDRYIKEGYVVEQMD